MGTPLGRCSKSISRSVFIGQASLSITTRRAVDFVRLANLFRSGRMMAAQTEIAWSYVAMVLGGLLVHVMASQASDVFLAEQDHRANIFLDMPVRRIQYGNLLRGKID